MAMGMKRILGIAMAALLLALAAIPAAASGDSYVLDGLKRVAVPDFYECQSVYQVLKNQDGTSLSLKNPQDLFINEQGFLFIADTGNNRIIKADTAGNVLKVFTEGGGKAFKNPQGLYADAKGNLYIADTDNSRIVHLDAEGGFVEELGVPDDLPSDDTTYYPSKLVISRTGYIYVVRGQNILTLDASNCFRGYLGQTQVGFDLTEFLIRIFASEEQKAAMIKRLAAPYTNIAIDPDNNLYASTLDYKTGEIKKLNSVGTNIFHETGSAESFSINFASLFLSNSYISSTGTAFYGDRRDDEGKDIDSYFVDIAFDDSGIVYALDKNTCRVYIYDQEGNLLGTFGSNGIQRGKFVMPSSIAIDSQENLYVLDANLGNIQLFRPTKYKQMVCEAIDVYYAGKYTQAHELWNAVLAVNENYTLARQGIGKTYLKQGDYQQSMVEFQKAGDVKGYSEAFSKNFYQVFRGNFVLFILLAAVICTVFGFLVYGAIRLSRNILMVHESKKGSRFGYLRTFQLTASAIFHPCETFDNVKYMRQGLKLLVP